MSEQEVYEKWVSHVHSTCTLSETVKQQKEWIVIRGYVCDVSNFLDTHPGGSNILETYFAKDATEDFESVGHSDHAIELLKQLSVGKVDKSVATTTTATTTTTDQSAQQNEGGWISSITNYLFN